ncbi:MAG: Trk system potassium transporter TrkA [Proteobacteria bacterium]|nr:Trk system potassium transporter TrkA [Pseudomonadota bacterium]MDA1058629.1 Trk system potassium transporter TrkA [Pseudomonadota bacterium]
MRIIVCGAGLVGSSIARQLASENNDVTIVDQSPETIQKMNETLDVRAIEGYASHPDVLEQAGARDAEMIVAVTQNDEINMVACQVAHSLFETPTKIARIRAQTYLDPAWQNLFSRNHLPIDVIISPEIEVARAITSRLNVPGASDMVSFVDDKVRVVAVSVEENCPIIDTPLRQLTELFPDLHMRVVGIVRREGIITPGGDDQILVGDEVYFTVDTRQVQRAMAAFGHEEKEARRIVVIGGGNIGLFVSKQIIDEIPDIRLKLIEVSRERAERVADQLERAVVIYGDSLAAEILAEANVKEADAVIAVTNDDQVNILSSLLAKREGAKRATTLVNNMDYGPLVRSLGIDAVVNPRAITVSRILQHIRRGRIRAVHSVRDGMAEIIEAETLDASPLSGKSLHDVKLPAGVIIGALARGDEVIIPRGDTIIETGDRVIVFATRDMVKKVEKLFAVRLDFF